MHLFTPIKDSIQTRIIAVTMMTTAAVVIIVVTILLVNNLASKRQNLVNSIVGIGQVVGLNSNAALAFQDPDTAEEILSALFSYPSITHATIFDANHKPFANFKRQEVFVSDNVPFENSATILINQELEPLSTKLSNGARYIFINDLLKTQLPITLNSKVQGSLVIDTDLEAFNQTIELLILIISGVVIGALIITYCIASLMQKFISRPILNLTHTMQKVSHNMDYSLRVEVNGGGEEIVTLGRGFNTMLEQIAHRDKALKQVVSDLEEARNQAVHASKAKSQFLACMSHEIRTPLNGVLGMAAILLKTNLSYQQKKFANTIERSGQALLLLINDILDFSKIEAGHLELEYITFNLREVVEDCIEVLSENAHNKGINIVGLVEPELPYLFKGDKVRVGQVLMNLVGNAIKFTEQGDVVIQVKFRESDQKVYIAVEDSGIGIASSAQENIFNEFSQADSSTTRRFGGTGLGLSICKKLTELMHGSIGVESELNQGAIFWFEIPLIVVEKKNTALHSPWNHKHALLVTPHQTVSDKKIEPYLKALSLQLKFWGISLKSIDMETFKALNLSNLQCDWIFIDQDTSNINHALTEPLPPIIYITKLPLRYYGKTLSSEKTLASTELYRPWRQSELYNALQQTPQTRLSEGVLLEKESNQVLDSARCYRVLVVEDNIVNQLVASEMLKHLGGEVTLADNGEQAVSLWQSKKFDIIFMDCQMPVMDGLEATQKIRALEAKQNDHSSIPIIAFTANAIASDREEYWKVGMTDFLEKPIEHRDLEEKLDQWLDARQLESEERSLTLAIEKKYLLEDHMQQQVSLQLNSSFDNPHREHLNDIETSLDKQVLTKLRSLKVDEDIVPQLLCTFVQTSNPLIHTIKQALSDKNIVTVQQSVHTLKSSSASIGGKKLSEECQKLELRLKSKEYDIEQVADGLFFEYQRLLTAIEMYSSDFVTKGTLVYPQKIQKIKHKNSNNIKLLVVDDDENIRLLARKSLVHRETEILEAECARDALSLLEHHQADIILLDVNLPDKSGFDVCKILKQKPQYEDVPVLITTGMDDIESIKQAYNAGATEFVTKPINWFILKHRLQYMLRSRDNYRQLKFNEQRLKQAQKIAGLGDWSWQCDNGLFTISEEVFILHNFKNTETVNCLQDLFYSVHPDDKNSVIETLQDAYDNKINYQIEYRVTPNDESDDRYIVAKGSVEQSNEIRVKRLTGTFQDITDRKHAEMKIMSLAYYDTLTKLPNRKLFFDRLYVGLERTKRLNMKVAILFIDLDNFKTVNDSLGHDMGDQLLKIVAQRLQQSLRSVDTVSRLDKAEKIQQVARLGGDEFVILLTDMKRSTDASIVAQRVLNQLSEPIMLDETELYVTTSIGIGVYPDDAQESSELLKHADFAMYHAKKQGRNNYQFFSAAMNQQATHRLAIESALKTAIKYNELELHYQPIWDSKTNAIISIEALLRWNSQKLGSISPIEFIPIAEESGVICDVGEWVLRQACAQIHVWRCGALKHLNLNVSVNISAVQFDRGDLSQKIGDILEEFNLSGEALCIELTESVLMSKKVEVFDQLERLKSLGIKLAIDDFGTGYSSFNALKTLPLDTLKIDRTFIKDIETDPDDVVIIQAMIAMAHQLGLNVVAEGVENTNQQQFLIQHHCDLLQGYLMAKPCPASVIESLLLSDQTLINKIQ